MTTTQTATCPTCGWMTTGEQPLVGRMVTYHERKWQHIMTVANGYDYASVVNATGSYFTAMVPA